VFVVCLWCEKRLPLLPECLIRGFLAFGFVYIFPGEPILVWLGELFLPRRGLFMVRLGEALRPETLAGEELRADVAGLLLRSEEFFAGLACRALCLVCVSLFWALLRF